MGITFRSGGYIKHVFIGGRTIKDGEAAAIWNRRGVHRQIIGPKRIWMYSSTIRFLTRYKAESNQYLVISHRDGRVEYVRGPTTLYENPAFHDSVSVQDAIRLESEKDCIFVTIENNKGSTKSFSSKNEEVPEIPPNISKNVHQESANKVIKGPLLYFPQIGEKIHEFSWSVIDSKNIGDICENGNKFIVLSLAPNRTFTIHAPLRTSDSFTLGAKLDFICHIESLEDCILSFDPIAKMHSAVLTDLFPFGSDITKDEMLGKDVTKKLSLMETYPSLIKVAKQCGFVIDDAKLTGITFGEDLKSIIQNEHNLTLNLKNKLAAEKQKLTLQDLELENRRSSIEKENELKKMQMSLDEELRQKYDSIEEASLIRKLELTKQKVAIHKTIVGGYTESVISFLADLQEKDVDLTRFMCTTPGMSLALPILSEETDLDEYKSKTKDLATRAEKQRDDKL